MNYWLIKSEPNKYSWQNLEADKVTFWEGVRNFQARNHLKAMKENDFLLFYHSNLGKEIVGLAKVSKEAYADTSASEGDWVGVEVACVKKFPVTVSLTEIRSHEVLKNMNLVKQSRLSVTPVSEQEFKIIGNLAGITLD